MKFWKAGLGALGETCLARRI